MGRYTQRRRAASGSSPAIPAPPTGVAITDVQAQAAPGVVHITFAGTVSFTPGFYSDSAFSINGNPVGSVNSIPSSPGTVVECSVTGFWTAGSTWDVSGQPSWLVDSILTPQSGVVT